MKKIRDLSSRAHLSIVSGSPVKQEPCLPQETTSFKAEYSDENLAIINRIFLKLAAIYGNTWRNIYKSHEFLQFTKQEWLEGLAGYEEKLLYQTIAICRQTLKFPPTLPEFIDCYKYIQSKHSFFFRKEQVEPASIEVVNENLTKMKEMLQMKRQH